MGEEFKYTPCYTDPNPYRGTKERMKILVDMCRDDEYYKDR